MQDSLTICHEPVKIPKRNIALHLLMKQAEYERIGYAIKLDKKKRELENERAIEAEAKKVLKVREKSLDSLFQIDKKESVFIGTHQKQEIFSNQMLSPELALLICYMTVLNYLIKH